MTQDAANSSANAGPPLANVIFLVGFMGSGKSTAGKLLAQHVAWKFVDLDVLIEQEENTTIAEIFQYRGEAAFRRKEHELLRRLVEESQRTAGQPGAGRVIALGGGTFAQPPNFELLQQIGRAHV